MAIGDIFNLLTGKWLNLGGFIPTLPGSTGSTIPANSLLKNGSFESAANANVDGSLTLGALDGWTSTKNNFELWSSGTNGVKSTDARNFIEIDAERGTISQTVKTNAQQPYTLLFDVSGRPGAVESSKMEVLWNNKVVATVNPTDANWNKYMLTVEGTGGNDTLSFRSLANDLDSLGGLLDNVVLTPGNLPASDGRSADIGHIDLTQASINALKQNLDPGETRELSGLGNNLNNPEFGKVDEPLIRLTDVRLGTDGAPRGVVNGVQTLPNERDISNVIANQDENGDGVEEKTTSLHDTNLFLMSFGQFFDHGLDFLKRSTDAADVYTIALKPGDKLYRFSDDGDPRNDVTSITLRRGEEAIDPNTGEVFAKLAHTNKPSPFIDMSQAYGSSDAIGYYLRESKRDANGNVVLDAEGKIVKLATMANGGVDAAGRPNLPTYYDILINNGMSKADLDKAIAANSFEMLQMTKGYVDHRNAIDPATGQPSGSPLLLDAAPSANPAIPGFKLSSLMEHRIGGDGRVNENIQLTPIHEIFFRDHEYWVDSLREKTGNSWSEEQYFQAAKQIVEGEYQRVIFDEFIDALAGSLPGPIPHGFDGYHPRVDAQISEEFAHAIYRVGHSMITEKLPFIDAKGEVSQMSLVEAFLNPQKFEDLGTTSIITGQTLVAHERIDENLVNAVRNQLLGQPSDLAAINIARGREVGLPSLNEIRKMLYERGSAEVENGSDVTRALKGNPELKPYANWDEFAKNLRDPSLVELFKKVYKSVDDVDAWIGGLAEKPRSQEEGQMGTTFTWIFWEQMDRLQDGDQFYYKGRFSDTEILGELETQTFADIIMRTTDAEFLNDKVFFLTKQIRMDLAEKARTFTAANETIVGNALDNEIKAGAGNDTVYGQAGNDRIHGDDGDDGLRGEDGDDMIWGGAGGDRVSGGEGNDQIWGGDEQDALNGNEGNDTIYGDEGDDEVHGNEGDDRLFGGNGNDVIKGGTGNDTIDAGAGDDRIETNGGNDQVETGSGRDTILMSDDPGQVIVQDFDLDHDRIDMSVFNINNLADLNARLTITKTGPGAVLKIDQSEILLKGVKADKLTLSHFKFENDVRNLVLNGRMDEGRIVVLNGEAKLVEPTLGGDYNSNEASVGWKNANDDRVEYQRDAGNLVLELDVDNKQDEIFQLLPTRKGEVYTLSFDSMTKFGGGTSTVEVLWNGVVVGKVDPADRWATYSYEVTGTGGKDKLSFREEAGDNNGYGALLDNVIVAPKDSKPENYELTGNDNDNVYKDMTDVTEYVDGRGGQDRFEVAAASAGFTLERNPDFSWNLRKGSELLAVLTNIETVRFTDADYVANASGGWTKVPTGQNTINGTDGDDWLEGGDGNDMILGGKGYDGLAGRKGNDVLDGGEGYDEVILSGKVSDYTFTKNADGTFTVKSVAEGTDTLKSIDAAWFEGSQELRTLDSLANPGSGTTLTGTDGDDWLEGGDGDDMILGGKGYDGLAGRKGNDMLDGGEGYDEVILSGKVSDYTFTKNADGTFTVKSVAEGTDTLKSIDAAWFEGSQELRTLDSLANPGSGTTLTGTDGDDWLEGGDGDDMILGGKGYDGLAGRKGNDMLDGGEGKDDVILDGAKEDYIFARNADGTYNVSSAAFGQDVLANIEGVWFEGAQEYHAIDQLTN